MTERELKITNLKQLISAIVRVEHPFDTCYFYKKIGNPDSGFSSCYQAHRDFASILWDEMYLDDEDEIELNESCYGCRKQIDEDTAGIKIVGKLWDTYPDILLFCDMGCYQLFEVEQHHFLGECPECENMMEDC